MFNRVAFLAVCLTLSSVPVLAQDKTPPGWAKGEKEGWDGDVPPGWSKWKKARRALHKAHLAKALAKARKHAAGTKHLKAHVAEGLLRRAVNGGLPVDQALAAVQEAIDAKHPRAGLEVALRHIARAHHKHHDLDHKALRHDVWKLIRAGHKGKALADHIKGHVDRRVAKKKGHAKHHAKKAVKHARKAHRAADKGHGRAAKAHGKAAKAHGKAAKHHGKKGKR